VGREGEEERWRLGRREKGGEKKKGGERKCKEAKVE